MAHATRTGMETTWPLLQTVFESIFEVFILCFAGWILARRNLLDKKTQKKLNILNINLFTPALLFSKVAFFLSPSKLRELWIIPPIFVLVTLTSMATSWGLAKACRLRRSQRSFAIAAAMFMNSNSLPIALMQSLVITVHGLKWGNDDTRDAMLGRALTYLVLHSTFGMMLRWSFGVRLLAQADEEVVAPPEEEVVPPTEGNGQDRSNSHSKGDEREPLLGSSQHHRDYSSATLRSQSSVTYTQTDDENVDNSQSRPRTPTRNKLPELRAALHQGGVSHPITAASALPANTETLGLPAPMGKRPAMVNKQSHFFYSFPNTPQLSSSSLAPSRWEQSAADLPGPTTQSPLETRIGTRIKTRVSSFATRTRKGLAKWGKGVRAFMTPPLYSALFSLVVACIPPLQHLLDAHLKPVKGAINSAGNCSIPITLVVLGGYFWRGDESAEQTGSNQPRRLRTDLPQQVQTAAPPFVRRKTKFGSRSDALDTPMGEGRGTLTGRVVTSEPTGMDGDTAGEGIIRPVSDATLVGASTSSATPTWSRAWMGLKSRSRPRAKAHADDDEHTAVHPPGNAGSSAAIPSNGIPPPVTAPAKSLEEHTGEARTVLVAILSRMIITPMILLPIMALVMSKTTMRLFDDPVFVVANVLFISSPPALTLAQITQAASGDAFERLISKTIFWSYCIVTPITTMVYVFIGLELSRL